MFHRIYVISKSRIISQNRVRLAAFFAVMIALLSFVSTQAQTVGKEWVGPRRLSSPGVENAGELKMVPDQYGNLHLFWSEALSDGYILQYTVFDGEIWQEPIDIRAVGPGAGFGFYSPQIDESGMLHLVWTEGVEGPVYYAHAPANNAMTVHAWSEPLRIPVAAFEVNFIVNQGTFHLLYSDFFGSEPGVYYTRSTDNGRTWSQSEWFDPDIPLTDAPAILQFVADGKNGLHITWYYKDLESEGIIGRWIRYAHSLDGGDSWSTPFTIDYVENEDDPSELALPYPALIVSGDQVHVIWAGTRNVEREHRYSLDRGVTWTETTRVFGRLLGQALGDGLTVDANGRIHFFGQIRWPQGVYHAVWDEDHWSTPNVVYLISRSDAESKNGRYHAHGVRAGMLAGNQIFLAFADEANGPLYGMYHTLDDVTALPFVPTPLSTAVPATPQAAPTATPLSLSVQTENTFSDIEEVPNLGASIWLGVLPAALFVLGVVLMRAYRYR